MKNSELYYQTPLANIRKNTLPKNKK
jgi:hypothetical protein